MSIVDRHFFVREASALEQRRPERAASMWLEAAACGDERTDGHELLGDIERALELQPEARWVLSRARRLLMQWSCYDSAVAVGRREIAAGGDSEVRTALLYELSGLLLYEHDDAKAALESIRQALLLQPHHVPSLVRGVTLTAQLQRYDEQVQLATQLANCVGDPLARANLFYRAATVRDTRLRDTAAAAAAYRRAIDIYPQHVPAVLALAQLCERTANWVEVCRCFERLADAMRDPAPRARFWRQAGALHLDLTGDLDAACRLLGRAARALPGDASVLQRLAQAYEMRGQFREQVQVLQQLLAVTGDGQGRAALLTQIASVLLEQLHDVDTAIATFRQVLQEVPGYLPALQSLATLYRQRGDHEHLVAMANLETEGLLPAEARAVRYVEQAETLERDLGRSDEAIVAYRRALELAPELYLAFHGLTSLLQREGRHEELAESLARQAEVSDDPRTKAHLLLRRARLQADLLHQPSAAIETLQSVDNDDASRAVALELIDFYGRTEQHAERAQQLLEQAKQTQDPREMEGHNMVAAQLLERLQEGDRALAIYREVLSHNPRSLAAVHGIGRMLHQRGSWDELVRLYHHELSHQPKRTDASMLLCRIGRLLAEKLGQPGAAIDAYVQALARDPGCTPALFAIEQLARLQQRGEELVGVLERYAAARGDGTVAGATLIRAAEIAGWQLGDTERAASLFASALRRDDHTDLARHGLLRLRLRREQWAEAVTLIEQVRAETENDEEAALAALMAATVCELRLDQPADLVPYERAAAAFGEQLREELTRVHRLRDAKGSAAWLLSIGPKVSDNALAGAYLLEAAQILELGRSDPEGTLVASRQAQQRRPSDPAAVWALERALLRHDRWDELARLREQEAQLEVDRLVRIHGLLRSATAWWHAGELGQATRLCREALNLDARWVPALKVLTVLLEEQGQWRELAEALERLAEACSDSSNRLTLSMRAQEVWETQVGDTERSLASLSIALSEQPAHPAALACAERLISSTGDTDQLSRLYQRAIRATQDEQDRAELLRRHVDLLCELHQTSGVAAYADRALVELATLVTLRPQDAGALSRLAQLQCQQQRWADAAETLEHLSEASTDESERQRAQLQLARLWLQQLHDPARAHRVMDAAKREHPDDVDVLRLSVELATTLGDWSGAKEVLTQLEGAGSAADRVWAVLRLATVHRVGLHDEAGARELERRALLMAVDDGPSLAVLTNHFHNTRDRERMVELAEALLEENSATPYQTGLRALVARVAVEDLAEPKRALSHLQELQRAEPTDTGTLLLLARAQTQEGEHAAAVQHYRQVLESDATCVDAYRGLMRAGGPEVASAAASMLDYLGASGPAEQTLLARIAAERPTPRSFAAEPPQPERRFEALQEVLQTIAPFVEGPAPKGAERGASAAVAAAATQLSTALGLGELRVLVGAVDTAIARPGQPLSLVLAPWLAGDQPAPAFRFWVGRALGRALCGGVVAFSLDDASLHELLAALQTRRGSSGNAEQLRRHLSRSLPRRARRHLAELSADIMDPQLWAGYRKRLARWADRIALVMCRLPGVGLQLLTEHDHLERDSSRDTELAQLMRFSVSEDYARLHRLAWP